MAKIDVKPATYEMITEFYGKPPKNTQKSFAVIEDGKIISIAGIQRVHGRAILFSDSLPEVKQNMKKYAKAAAKCIKLLMPYMKEIKYVVSMADARIDKSEDFLKHYGFEQREGGYVWQSRA